MDMLNMSLKLLIDTKRQKVLFAEADQKSIDFLSRILTLPMPTLLNLFDDEPKLFGCVSNFFQRGSGINYETLHNPKTPVGYTCNKGAHNYFSDAASVCPKCREAMSVQMRYVAPPVPKVSGMYMVMDDLVVSPILSTVSALASLSKFNLKVDFATVEEKVVDLGLYQALELLKNSLVYLLKNAGSFEIKKRTADAISNVICGRSSRGHIKRLVRQGCIDPMCNLVVFPEPDVVTPCHKGLEKLVKLDPTHYVQMIVDAGGMEKLLKIENHEDSDICRMAKFIISKISN